MIYSIIIPFDIRVFRYIPQNTPDFCENLRGLNGQTKYG